MRIDSLLFSALALLMFDSAGPVRADQGNKAPLSIHEWEVPFETGRPRDPWVADADTVWFVGQKNHYVGRLTPSSGEFKRYPLADGVGPHTVISNQHGIWYAGNRDAHVGRLDPDSGEITRFVPPGDGRRDVHSMASDSQGRIWFTEQGGNRIGRFDPRDGSFEMHDIATDRARPYGIIVYQDQPWVAALGSNRLITVRDGTLEEVVLPREETRVRRLAATSEGVIYYTDWATGRIGRYDPASGDSDDWLLPGGEDSGPYAAAMDAEDRFWVVETRVSPNRFVGFDTRSGEWLGPQAVPSGGGSVRHMVYDADSNAIWFGSDNQTIGRANL